MDRLIPDYEHASYSIRKVGTCFALTMTFPDGPPDEHSGAWAIHEYRTFDSWAQMNEFILEHIYVIPHQEESRKRNIFHELIAGVQEMREHREKK